VSDTSPPINPGDRSTRVCDLKITLTDTSEGEVILGLRDVAGKNYEVRLGSIDVAALISALSASMQELLDDPTARSQTLPGMQRVQLVESSKEVLFRVFLTDRLFHEYPVPINTTLSEDLRFLADRVAARQEARITNRPPDSISGKN
jgi:hypothetical protein